MVPWNGTLGLVAQDVDWQQFPGVLTSPIDVTAGQQAIYRARPTFDYPADYVGNAEAGSYPLQGNHSIQWVGCWLKLSPIVIADALQ